MVDSQDSSGISHKPLSLRTPKRVVGIGLVPRAPQVIPEFPEARFRDGVGDETVVWTRADVAECEQEHQWLVGCATAVSSMESECRQALKELV